MVGWLLVGHSGIDCTTTNFIVYIYTMPMICFEHCKDLLDGISALYFELSSEVRGNILMTRFYVPFLPISSRYIDLGQK